ncbi:hypothetical protein UlMin_039454 [Ulmus minor]
MFGANDALLLKANGISKQVSKKFPFTPLLIPLESPPNTSQIIKPLPPPPTAPPLPYKCKTWVYALLGALGGAALVLVLAAITFYKFFPRGDEKTDLVLALESFAVGDKTTKNKIEEESPDFSISKMAQFLNVYNFQELKVATNGFSHSSLIKGSINLLQKINHSNLIHHSRFCFNEGNWYLVYEYAAKGPLTLDVAIGLNYLHSFATPPHVHKDIKSSNSLLDNDFWAKIANFRLARSVEEVYVLFEGNMNLSDVLNGFLGDEGEESLRKHMDSSIEERYSIELACFAVKMIDSCLQKKPVLLAFHG